MKDAFFTYYVVKPIISTRVVHCHNFKLTKEEYEGCYIINIVVVFVD